MRRFRPHRTAWVLAVVAVVILLAVVSAVWVTTLSATAAEPEIDWRVTGDGPATPTSAAVAGGLVLLADGRSLTALDAETGERRWSLPEVSGPVRIGADAFAVAAGDGVAVYDLATGAERFAHSAELGHNPPYFAVSTDTLFTAERDGRDRRLVATSLATGAELWHRGFGVEIAVAVPVVADPVRTILGAPLPVGGVQVAAETPVVYVNTGLREEGTEETLVLDAATGKQTGRPDALMDLDRYPLIAAGEGRVVTVGKREGCRTDVTVYDPAADTTSAIPFGTRCYPEPPNVHVADGALIGQNTDGYPQVVRVDSGEIRWTSAEPGVAEAYLEPVVAYDGPDREAPLTLANVSGGDAPWSAEDSAPPQGTSTLAGDMLISSTGTQPDAMSPDSTYATTAYDLGIDKLMWHQPGARLLTYTSTHLILRIGPAVYGDATPVTIVAVPYT